MQSKLKLVKKNKNYDLIKIYNNGTYIEETLIGTSCENLFKQLQSLKNPLNEEPITFYKLSFRNCQEIERGYDLYKLAEEWVFDNDKNSMKWSNNNDSVGDIFGSFKAGFLKCLELFSNYKFTENDMINAYRQGTNDGAEHEALVESGEFNDVNDIELYEKQLEESFMETLIKNTWDVEILEELDENDNIILKTI